MLASIGRARVPAAAGLRLGGWLCPNDRVPVAGWEAPRWSRPGGRGGRVPIGLLDENTRFAVDFHPLFLNRVEAFYKVPGEKDLMAEGRGENAAKLAFSSKVGWRRAANLVSVVCLTALSPARLAVPTLLFAPVPRPGLLARLGRIVSPLNVHVRTRGDVPLARTSALGYTSTVSNHTCSCDWDREWPPEKGCGTPG